MKSLMKPLKTHVKESIFDNVEDITNSDAALIEQFLKDNYIIEGSYTIKDNVVDVKGSLEVKNEKIHDLRHQGRTDVRPSWASGLLSGGDYSICIWILPHLH